MEALSLTILCLMLKWWKLTSLNNVKIMQIFFAGPTPDEDEDDEDGSDFGC